MLRNPLPVSLSIVIPAYNEEKRLPATLDRVREYLSTSQDPDWECIVVDDGSKDGTADFVSRTSATERRIRLVKNPGNRGKKQGLFIRRFFGHDHRRNGYIFKRTKSGLGKNSHARRRLLGHRAYQNSQ